MIAVRALALSLAIGCLGASLASAYVPPAEYQIQQLVKKHAGLKSVRIRSRLSDGAVHLNETVWYESASRLLRGRIVDAAGETVYTYQKKLGENGVTASSFLFEPSAGALLRNLAAEGVQWDSAPDDLSIGRVHTSIGWTVGRGAPSFWILKDEFLPLKWIPKTSGDAPEVVFEETKYQRDFPYSRLITVNLDKKEVLRLEAVEVSLNPDLSDVRSTNFQVSDAPSVRVIQNLLAWIR